MELLDIIQLVKSGKSIPIEITLDFEEWIDGRYEEGMKTYITKVIDEDDFSVSFLTDEREFSEYNKSLEKPIYCNRISKQYNLKWSEINKEYVETDYIFQAEFEDILIFKVINEDSF